MMRFVPQEAQIAVASCGGGDETGVEDEDLFGSAVPGGRPGCVTCLSPEPDRVVVGPTLTVVGERAATWVPGRSAAEYLRTSIVTLDSHVLEGSDPGRMRSNWADVLTDAQVDAVVDDPEDP